MFYTREAGKGWAVVLLWLWYGFVGITEAPGLLPEQFIYLEPG